MLQGEQGCINQAPYTHSSNAPEPLLYGCLHGYLRDEGEELDHLRQRDQRLDCRRLQAERCREIVPIPAARRCVRSHACRRLPENRAQTACCHYRLPTQRRRDMDRGAMLRADNNLFTGSGQSREQSNLAHMKTCMAELRAQQNQASPEGPNRTTAHQTGKNLCQRANVSTDGTASSSWRFIYTFVFCRAIWSAAGVTKRKRTLLRDGTHARMTPVAQTQHWSGLTFECLSCARLALSGSQVNTVNMRRPSNLLPGDNSSCQS